MCLSARLTTEVSIWATNTPRHIVSRISDLPFCRAIVMLTAKVWSQSPEMHRAGTMTSHAGIVVDQFTRQAAPFAGSVAMRDEDALRLLVEFSGATPSDTVLDVACGPGLVVAAFARVAHHATGIDLTPAMIEKAREHAAGLGLTNVDWRIGNVLPLPFPDRAFSLVVSRFAFHHFPDPAAVMREMVRVCTRPGRVVVADIAASDDPERAAALNRMERL